MTAPQAQEIVDLQALLEGVRSRLALQELLVRDIDHRSKNAIQLAVALLTLKARKSVCAETRQALEMVSAQLVAFSAAHALLEADDVAMDVYLSQVCEALRGDGRVEIVLRARPLRLPSRMALPLGLLVSEAIVNALKHAFHSERAGLIRVELAVDGDQAALTIADNGSGAAGAAKTGSGSELIRAFARQVGGSLEIVSRPGEGVTVRSTFAIERQPSSAAQSSE